jgi:hypothetical protein
MSFDEDFLSIIEALDQVSTCWLILPGVDHFDLHRKLFPDPIEKVCPKILNGKYPVVTEMLPVLRALNEGFVPQRYLGRGNLALRGFVAKIGDEQYSGLYVPISRCHGEIVMEQFVVNETGLKKLRPLLKAGHSRGLALMLEAYGQTYAELLAGVRKVLEDHYEATLGVKVETAMSLVDPVKVVSKDGPRLKHSFYTRIQPLSDMPVPDDDAIVIVIPMPLATVTVMVTPKTRACNAYVERDGYFEYCHVGFAALKDGARSISIIGREVQLKDDHIYRPEPETIVGLYKARGPSAPVWEPSKEEKIPEIPRNAYGPVIPFSPRVIDNVMSAILGLESPSPVVLSTGEKPSAQMNLEGRAVVFEEDLPFCRLIDTVGGDEESPDDTEVPDIAALKWKCEPHISLSMPDANVKEDPTTSVKEEAKVKKDPPASDVSVKRDPSGN